MILGSVSKNFAYKFPHLQSKLITAKNISRSMMPIGALVLQFYQLLNTNLFIFCFLITVITMITLYFLKKPNNNASKLPPSPFRLPLIGNLHQLGSLPHHSFLRFSKKYGPLMQFQVGSVPILIVSSSELAQEVMKTHDIICASRPSSTLVKRLAYDCDVAAAPYGDYWRQLRKICVLQLLSTKRVQSFRSIREEEVSLMVEKIRGSKSLVNVSEMIVSVTNNVISRVALGRKYYGEEGGVVGVRKILGDFMELLGAFPFSDFIPWLSWIDRLSGLDAKVDKTFKALDGFLERVIKEHEHKKIDKKTSTEEEFEDFVDVLLSLEINDAAALKKDSIKALILDMFTGGTDTTFTLLEWLMAELIRHPTSMKKVQEEIRRIVGNQGEVTEEHINQMNYLKIVIKETLRLHPPLPLLVPREAIKDFTLHGYEISAGTRILINAYAIGRDPKSWENPDEFCPERFMLKSEIDFRGQDFEFIPFGGGRRVCPGIGFGTSIAELIAAELLYHFHWDLPDGIKRENLDMTETPGLVVHMKNCLLLAAKPYFCHVS